MHKYTPSMDVYFEDLSRCILGVPENTPTLKNR